LFLVGGVALAWMRPEWLSPITARLPPLVVVAPALFLMALGLDGARLYGAVVRPLPALWAVVISYGAVPTLGWLGGWLLLHPEMRLGLMISASVPCTLASAVLWTRLAGGNEATALLVILLTTGTSWLATTFWLFLGTGTHVHIDAGVMMTELFLVLVVPVAVGQLLRALKPVARMADRWRGALGVVSRLLILAIILKAAVDFRRKVAQLGGNIDGLDSILITGVVCIGIHLLALAAGLWSSKTLGFDRPNQIAVAFACSQKTLPVALFVFESHFREAPLAVVPLVFYHGGQLFVDTFIAERMAGGRLDGTALAGEATMGADL
jgi:sodium/bile acid cotransporter 7